MADNWEKKLPIPPLSTTAYTAKCAKTFKKRKTEEEKKQTKLENRVREKTRVFLGKAYVPWREVRDAHGLKSDENVALFLLDRHDAPSISDVPKYIVDEDRLLQLFKDCPVCGSMCEVQKTTRGTFLAVHQLCPKCHFSRNWRSQQTDMAVPSGDAHNCTSDPESSAAARAAAITAIIGFSDEQNRDVCDHSMGSPGESQGPKRNDVINSDDGNQLKRHLHISNENDENEECQGNSHSTDKEQEHDHGSDVNNELADETSEVDSGDHNSDCDLEPPENHSNKGEASDDAHSCTSDPESSAAAITAIIAGSSDEDDSSDSEMDGGDHNSDGDWKHGSKLGTDGKYKKYKYKYKKPNSDSDWKTRGSKLGTDGKCEKKYKKPNSDSDWKTRGSKKCEEKYKKPYSHKSKLCPECGAFFLSHKAHTCEYKKPHSCNVCGKRFVLEYKLKIHSKIHKDSYKHVCKYCFSTFRMKPDKLVHENSHSYAEKPYQCPDCPEVFAKKQERCEHQLSHTGSKINICHICNMEFSKNHILERHMAVHTKLKQFVCDVCQRSFTQSYHLKSHMRVHTGEKPYQCQNCDKSFNHNISLKSHIQRYHGQVPEPGMKVQMEKTNRNASEVEKDETIEMESRAVDAEEAEQSMETLCNSENGDDKCTKSKNYRPRGRPKGRPKNAVITSNDANQS